MRLLEYTTDGATSPFVDGFTCLPSRGTRGLGEEKAPFTPNNLGICSVFNLGKMEKGNRVLPFHYLFSL